MTSRQFLRELQADLVDDTGFCKCDNDDDPPDHDCQYGTYEHAHALNEKFENLRKRVIDFLANSECRAERPALSATAPTYWVRTSESDDRDHFICTIAQQGNDPMDAAQRRCDALADCYTLTYAIVYDRDPGNPLDETASDWRPHVGVFRWLRPGGHNTPSTITEVMV